jgi:hypothetical protein
LIQQLSPQGKRAALFTLIPEMDKFAALVDYGEKRVLAISKQKGIDWSHLSEEEREQYIDVWLHEN